MKVKPVKRFIAGAVCPSCGAQDTVRMYQQEAKEYRECVDCGFSDEFHQKPAQEGQVSASGEPTLHEPEKVKGEDVQVIQILDS